MALFPSKKTPSSADAKKKLRRRGIARRRSWMFFERLEARQVLTTGPLTEVVLLGTKFYDENGNSHRDANEQGLAGWTIYLDLNDNDALENDEPSTTTDDQGNYRLTIPNDSVATIREVMQPGWEQMFPGTGEHHVGPTANTTLTGLDFGNRISDVTYFSSIRGNVWNDLNQDANRDNTEPGLEGWQVFLDSNDNGLLDAGERWTYSDGDGNYKFDQVIPNNYKVRELVQTGWQQTFPTGGSHSVAAGPRDTIINADFGNMMTQSGEIRGTKWSDTNGDGVRQNDEGGVSGWRIYFDDNLNGQMDPTERSTITDIDGKYSFQNVPIGKHVIGEAMPDVWRQQFPARPTGFDPAPIHVIPFAPDNVGAKANQVQAIDINGNGLVDVFVFDRDRGQVSLLNGMGAGRFESPQDLFVGRDVKYALAADVDGDQLPDIVTFADEAATGLVARHIRIDTRHNNGNGTFSLSHSTVLDGILDYGTLADVDKNGSPDAVLTRYLSTTDAYTQMTVLTNDGTGLFTHSPDQLLPEITSGAIVSGDLTGDGYVDRVVVDGPNNQLLFFRNNGRGFVPAAALAAGLQPIFIVMGDLNGDQARDLVAINGAGDFSVFLNNKDGTFAPEVRAGGGLSGALSAVLGDLDGDNALDLAITSGGSNSISLYFNNGTGTFGAGTSYGAGLSPSAIVNGDLDHDGDGDLAVTNSGSKDITVLLNDGTAAFTSGGTYSVGESPTSIVLGYLNGDSNLDFLVGTDTGSKFQFLNNGDGTYGSVQPFVNDRSNRSFVVTGDLAGDSAPDVLNPRDFSHFLSLWINDGDGYYFESLPIDVGGRPSFVTTGDLNGDGKADIITAYLDSNNLGVFLNNGNGTFTSGGSISLAQPPSGITTGDLDNDGDVDVTVSSQSGNIISILTNNGTGVLSPGAGIAAAGANAIETGDLNGDGHIDVLVSLGGNHIGVLRNDVAPPYRQKTDVVGGGLNTDLDFGNQKLSWKNHGEPLDIDGDSFIAPLDALILINYLNKHGSILLTPETPFIKPYYDPSGDDFIAPNDVLLVINYLNGVFNGEGESTVAAETAASMTATSAPVVNASPSVVFTTPAAELGAPLEAAFAPGAIEPSVIVVSPSQNVASSKSARSLFLIASERGTLGTDADVLGTKAGDKELETSLDDIAEDVAAVWQDRI